MFVVDTNLLVYGANDELPEHERCRRLLLEWRGGRERWYLTWGVIYEFLRVSTHPDVMGRPFSLGEAWAFVQAILSSPPVGILLETERHGRILREVASLVPAISGNLVFDAHTAILMKEHGIRRIYTRDAHFRRFPFLEVINPLA